MDLTDELIQIETIQILLDDKIHKIQSIMAKLDIRIEKLKVAIEFAKKEVEDMT